MTDYVKRLADSVEAHLEQITVQSPALYLQHDAWEHLDQKLADPFFAELHARNLQAIECLRSQANGRHIFDVPVTLDAQPAQYGYPDVWPSRVFKNIVCRATAAFYVTKEKLYLEYAIAAMDAACEMKEEWHCYAPQMGLRGANLETGDMLFAMAFGFDALYPHLQDEQRQRYITCLREEGLSAYMKGVAEGDWWTENSYNWNPSLNGNAVIAALVLLPFETARAQEVIRYALPRVGLHMHKYLDGGGYSEGPMYQGTGIGHMSDMAIAWYNITGDDLGLSEHQGFIDTLALWPYLIGGDGRAINVSNCDEYGTEYGAAQAAWWARKVDRPDLLDYHHKMLRPWQDTHQLFFDVEFFWYQDAHQAVVEPDVSGLKHFPEIDWLSYRAGDFWMFVTAGWNGGGHHNQDQGHFILGYQDERFLCDPGYGQSSADKHNTFRVAQNFCPGAVCPIQGLRSIAGGFYLAIDLQAAFPHATAYCRRHILVIDNKHVLLIDDVAGRQKEWSDGYREKQFADPTWSWQTRLPVDMSGNSFSIHGRNNSLRIDALSKIGQMNCTTWDHKGQIRTVSYRNYANKHKNCCPTFLSFDAGASCDWTVDGQTHTFVVDAKTFVFTDTDQGLVYTA